MCTRLFHFFVVRLADNSGTVGGLLFEATTPKRGSYRKARLFIDEFILLFAIGAK